MENQIYDYIIRGDEKMQISNLEEALKEFLELDELEKKIIKILENNKMLIDINVDKFSYIKDSRVVQQKIFKFEAKLINNEKEFLRIHIDNSLSNYLAITRYDMPFNIMINGSIFTKSSVAPLLSKFDIIKINFDDLASQKNKFHNWCLDFTETLSNSIIEFYKKD
jgi:oligoendopeptidase F